MGKKTVRGHDIANRFVYSLTAEISLRRQNFSVTGSVTVNSHPPSSLFSTLIVPL